MHHGVGGVEHQRPDEYAQHIDEQVDEGGTLAVEVRAQRGQQHRHSRADGDAHHDRQRDLKGDRSRDGQRLQNTHRSGRTLQNAGEHHAHQNTQQRVGKAGQNADERFALPQGGHRAGHGRHPVHQHGEAQQNLAHVAVGGLFVEHPQDDADDGHHAGDHVGAEQLHHAAAALQGRQAQDPPGDAGAQNRAHDHADGLPHLHHAGVDEAHHHHGGGGGGLDHGGDARAQQYALQRCAAQLIQHQLQPAARHLLQALAHEGHTKQEQCDAAQQRYNVRDGHKPIPSHDKLCSYLV